MAIVKTEGIIIRSQDYLESSKIVTCYTKDHGKVSLLAKGARRANSRLGGAVNLLHYVAVVYYQKENRELQTLSQADIVRSFDSFRGDLRRFSLAVTGAEIVDQLEMKEDPNQTLFRDFYESLQALEEAAHPELVLYQFIWRWLERSGFKPKLRRCLNCAAVPSLGAVQFKLSSGGYFCSNCRDDIDDSTQISFECIQLMLQMRDLGPHAIKHKLQRDPIMGELKRITWDFLEYHVGGLREIKSLSFLNRLKEFDAYKHRSKLNVTESE